MSQTEAKTNALSAVDKIIKSRLERAYKKDPGVFGGHEFDSAYSIFSAFYRTELDRSDAVARPLIESRPFPLLRQDTVGEFSEAAVATVGYLNYMRDKDQMENASQREAEEACELAADMAASTDTIMDAVEGLSSGGFGNSDDDDEGDSDKEPVGGGGSGQSRTGDGSTNHDNKVIGIRLKLAKLIMARQSFKTMLQHLGRSVALLDKVGRETFAPAASSDIIGVEIGNDVERALPGELALDDDTFAAKYVRHELAQSSTHAPRPEGEGEIIICLDISGSTSNTLDRQVSSAVAILRAAKKKQRGVTVIAFDDRCRTPVKFDANMTQMQRYNELLKLFTYAPCGGTNHYVAINEAIKIAKQMGGKPDIIINTDDGNFYNSDQVNVAHLTSQLPGVRVHFFGVGLVRVDEAFVKLCTATGGTVLPDHLASDDAMREAFDQLSGHRSGGLPWEGYDETSDDHANAGGDS